MSNIVPIRKTGALTRNEPRRLELFQRTVGKELRGAEVDEAIEWCELYGANPFVKDIYFFVFDADNDKRRVVPVLGIGLYRKIAARTGNYRPDEAPPRFAYDEAAKSPSNPTGMLWCEVSVNVFSHGAWHPVTSRVKWEERAPIKAGGFRWIDTGEKWPDTGKPKKKKVADDSVAALDEKKTNWHTMPETMMAKCCEADAIRKAWPNETAGSYLPEELDGARTIEGTATEIADAYATELRLKQVRADASILVLWEHGKPIDQVPIGSFGDRAIAFIRTSEPDVVKAWAETNRYALKEYWARDKAGAYEVKKELEERLS